MPELRIVLKPNARQFGGIAYFCVLLVGDPRFPEVTEEQRKMLAEARIRLQEE
jgi:hypothetical protein